MKISNALISFAVTILILSILPTSIKIASARCPNGTHKSPSGDCEQVVPHTGLPRCPNGFHRSPSGTCEQVGSQSSSSNNGGISSKSSSHLFAGDANNPSEGSSLLPSQTPTVANDNNNTLSSANTLTSSSAGKCDQSLWNHVYNPTRLQVVAPCKSVLGVIESKRVEKDGDYHIRVKLDPPFSNLINLANIKNQFGDLVVEPICVNRVTQADAISSCQNFHQNISIPPIGSHVNITGSYVLDKEHGNWAEIHPVTSITKIS